MSPLKHNATVIPRSQRRTHFRRDGNIATACGVIVRNGSGPVGLVGLVGLVSGFPTTNAREDVTCGNCVKVLRRELPPS